MSIWHHISSHVLNKLKRNELYYVNQNEWNKLFTRLGLSLMSSLSSYCICAILYYWYFIGLLFTNVHDSSYKFIFISYTYIISYHIIHDYFYAVRFLTKSSITLFIACRKITVACRRKDEHVYLNSQQLYSTRKQQNM